MINDDDFRAGVFVCLCARRTCVYVFVCVLCALVHVFVCVLWASVHVCARTCVCVFFIGGGGGVGDVRE